MRQRAVPLGLFSSEPSTMPEILGTSKSIYGFDPRSVLGCVLWLDGADSRTLTFSSGSNISSWADKSGNGNNATATGTPTYNTAGLNSRPAIAFNGSCYFQGNVSITGQTLTCFAVGSFVNSGGGDQRFVSLAATGQADWNSASRTTGINNQGSSTIISTYRNTPASFPQHSNPYGTPFIACSVYDGTDGYIYVNGLPGNVQASYASAGTFAISKYCIGEQVLVTGEIIRNGGFVSEILIYTTALTTAQRQAVEGYLAWKWGLNASLPTTHAFPLMKPHSRLFTLTDSLTPWIWFDGGDLNTFTLVPSTVNITSWSNKGLAGGNALSSTGAGTLNLAQMANGLTCVNFPAFANLGFTIGIPNQPRAWFAVFRQTSQVSNSGTGGLLQYFAVLNQTTGNGQDSLFGPGVPTNGTLSTYNVSSGASGIISGVGTLTAPNGYNVFRQYVWVNSATLASNTITIDGVAQTLSTSCNAGSYQTASVLYQIGDRYGNAGQVCELIQFNSEITVGQRQSVESYLATKWGLASLPVTHPYYVFNPLSALPFSPTNIPSCIVWLDGDDPAGTGVRPASGSTVSSWKDKSGQSNHFTGYVTNSWTPSLFNGCGGITMSGSGAAPTQGSYFQLPAASSPVNVGTTCTFFIVCYVLSTSTPASRLIATSYAGNADDYNDTGTFLVQWYSTSIELYRLLTNRVIISSTSAGTILLLSVVFDGTNMYFYKSGVLSGTGTPGSATGSAPSTGNFKFNTIAIGRYLGTTSGGYSFNGYALEYIMYNQALTTAQRQQVEGYLSAKWGTSLSVSHPYYKYFPAQQGFTSVTPSTISAVTLSSLSASGGTLSWTASTNAVEYFWYIGTASGSGTILTSGKVVSGTLTVNFSATLASGVTYYGWVIPRSSTLTNGATTVGSGSWSSASYATGGTISTTGGRRFHTFTTNGNFVLTTYPPTGPIEVMCIGGGGGGGCQSGGGGGAGNMIAATFASGGLPGQLSPGTYAVVVGTGGAGGQIGVSRGTNGTNTTFASTKIIALGGGGGGTYNIGTGGLNGGCGGGGSELGQLTRGLAGLGSTSGTSLFNVAFDGGTGFNDGSMGAAGGGGTSAVGGSRPVRTSAGADGGAGRLYYGSYYGGGGGGSQGGTYWGAPYNGGAGGIGGGGRGTGFTDGTYSEEGTPNTGGGGGGSSGISGRTPSDQIGRTGGTGVCIVSYVFP